MFFMNFFFHQNELFSPFSANVFQDSWRMRGFFPTSSFCRWPEETVLDKAEARSFIQVSHKCLAEAQALRPSSHACSDALAESWIRRGATGTSISTIRDRSTEASSRATLCHVDNVDYPSMNFELFPYIFLVSLTCIVH